MGVLVSVVVPVYNVEAYIAKCINSIISQTYADLEILLIDDGSEDASGEICETFAQKDKRIAVYHKTNGGLSSARNYGIDRATGRFVTFIDSDDYVSENYISDLLLNCENDGISICFHQKVRENCPISTRVAEYTACSCETITPKEAVIRFFNDNNYVSAWGKLYPLTFFEDVRFPVGMIYEDYATIYKLYRKAKRICVLETRNYFYVMRSNSITNRSLSRKNMDMINVLNDIEYTLTKENYEDSVTESFLGSKTKCLMYLYYKISISANVSEFKNELLLINSKIHENVRTVLISKYVKMSTKISLIVYNVSKKLFLWCMKRMRY